MARERAVVVGAGGISNAWFRPLIKEKVDIVVLAQLSMTIFKLSHPRPEEDFGVPVLTSGETGFLRVRDVLLSGHERSGRTSGGDRP